MIIHLLERSCWTSLKWTGYHWNKSLYSKSKFIQNKFELLKINIDEKYHTLFTEVVELSRSYICYCMPAVVRTQAHRSNSPAKLPECIINDLGLIPWPDHISC